VDLQTGSVVQLERSFISAVEEGDEEALQDMAEWAKQDMQVAKAIVGDSGERFLHALSKFDGQKAPKMAVFLGRRGPPAYEIGTRHVRDRH
jgi:hypothetical protein